MPAWQRTKVRASRVRGRLVRGAGWGGRGARVLEARAADTGVAAAARSMEEEGGEAVAVGSWRGEGVAAVAVGSAAAAGASEAARLWPTPDDA